MVLLYLLMTYYMMKVKSSLLGLSLLKISLADDQMVFVLIDENIMFEIKKIFKFLPLSVRLSLTVASKSCSNSFKNSIINFLRLLKGPKGITLSLP